MTRFNDNAIEHIEGADQIDCKLLDSAHINERELAFDGMDVWKQEDSSVVVTWAEHAVQSLERSTRHLHQGRFRFQLHPSVLQCTGMGETRAVLVEFIAEVTDLDDRPN